jgi:3-methyladenine DNA glycosylase AlkD
MTSHTPAAQAARIEASLREFGTPERAAQEQRYLKSKLDFLGATVWQVRAVVKAHVAEHGELDHDQLVALVEVLWAEPIHERRMAATALLELGSDMLTAADLPMLERLIRESLTWALVDGLAANVVGDILAADEAETVPILDRWATDDDFWVRRSALLAWLRPLRAGVPLDRFLSYADRMLEEREFFIRKAIGWVLRDVGRRRPAEVVDWLAPRTHRTSGVTMREATKYLPRADGDRLMLAYRERRPADS